MEMNELDDLHYFVNDLYERWVKGDTSYENAVEEVNLYFVKYKLMKLEPKINHEDLIAIIEGERNGKN